jgi:hypothetical protein
MAGLQVAINCGDSVATSTVHVTGSLAHVITQDEFRNFGISDDILKEAVRKTFGARPDDLYLSSPTPWNDLYKTYGWPQVTVNLVPVSAVITGVTTTSTIMKQQTFTNKSGLVGSFNTSIVDSVANTVSNSWSNSDKITVGQKISYKVDFAGSGVGGETSFSYEHSWGQTKTETLGVTLGSSSGSTVQLQPGQTVLVQLTASEGAMTVNVQYRASLSGSVAINYGGTFKGHHFWALDINSLGLNLSNTATEELKVGYFGNAEIVLKDSKTGNSRMLMHANAKPGIAADFAHSPIIFE